MRWKGRRVVYTGGRKKREGEIFLASNSIGSWSAESICGTGCCAEVMVSHAFLQATDNQGDGWKMRRRSKDEILMAEHTERGVESLKRILLRGEGRKIGQKGIVEGSRIGKAVNASRKLGRCDDFGNLRVQSKFHQVWEQAVHVRAWNNIRRGERRPGLRRKESCYTNRCDGIRTASTCRGR
jgi:hypothetical protein